uniref:Uncharacterized protein n=1 Tax=Corethron hystrix TaxID=216773 RepID=A0A7S1FLB9_9STRA|mmetsp:Transcript_10840/g.23813  ORF Transcript_10840/g.23813 Transcript_10840/m.23813 type:complete len:414 (+) Transcript_10840:82-1323(+)
MSRCPAVVSPGISPVTRYSHASALIDDDPIYTVMNEDALLLASVAEIARKEIHDTAQDTRDLEITSPELSIRENKNNTKPNSSSAYQSLEASHTKKYSTLDFHEATSVPRHLSLPTENSSSKNTYSSDYEEDDEMYERSKNNLSPVSSSHILNYASWASDGVIGRTWKIFLDDESFDVSNSLSYNNTIKQNYSPVMGSRPVRFPKNLCMRKTSQQKSELRRNVSNIIDNECTKSPTNQTGSGLRTILNCGKQSEGNHHPSIKQKKCKNNNRSLDKTGFCSVKSSGNRIRQTVIYRQKFSWRSYPELEAFLIANRDEYLRHSALNYTAQQKDFNNCLTRRLLELADKHNYVFSDNDFSFVTVRDRIRCYYKSYVQSSKKRGIIIGYAARKAGLISEGDLIKSSSKKGRIIVPDV